MIDIGALFIDVTALPENGYGLFQIFTLVVIYGYILCYASNMISDGSELLLCVPAYAGIVGSIVLPVLGAVPDGCIVLFSGLGPNAQSTLNVGVGALAGSTIMLLTVPWFLSVYGGRVNVDPSTGEAKYNKQPKLSPQNETSLFNAGVAVSASTAHGSTIMLLSAIPFLVLQGPAMFYVNMTVAKQAMKESGWSLIGLLLCIFVFCAYLWYQYRSANDDDQKEKQNARVLNAIENNKVTFLAVIYGELVAENVRFPDESWIRRGTPTLLSLDSSSKGNNYQAITAFDYASTDLPEKVLVSLERLLKPFFAKYDVDKSGLLDSMELQALLRDLGEKDITQAKRLKTLYENCPEFIEKNGLNIKEFTAITAGYVYHHAGSLMSMKAASRDMEAANASRKDQVVVGVSNLAEDEEEGEEEDEEEDIPEDLSTLEPAEQQRRIKQRAGWMLGIGTLIVLLFSDPMVNCLNEVGARTGIPTFYIGFVFGPIASNISEVIASYNYSMKKSVKSMKIAMSTLQGAAVMNNSFVLGIFMFLVYSQHLAWEFFAETLAVLLVQVAIYFFTMKKTHTLFDACCILALYPASLLLVAGLNAVGFD
jgi:Ca2+/Na+ antiporter